MFNYPNIGDLKVDFLNSCDLKFVIRTLLIAYVNSCLQYFTSHRSRNVYTLGLLKSLILKQIELKPLLF
jgi:hypothetical protein